MPSVETKHPRASDRVPSVDNPCEGYLPMPAKPWPLGEWYPLVKIGADGEIESVTAVPK
jgi:hypothetical protein